MSNIFPIDISIPLRFNGPQPNAYGVDRAISEPVRAGSLVGDTRQGGSVNFERYTFIPHCNGTHTECVGHITHKRISVRECLRDVIVPTVLVSVEPEFSGEEQILTLASLKNAGVQPPATAGGSDAGPAALIVRTLPNNDSKITAEYGEENIPPYFSADAMRLIVESGFTHLVCDLPSIDRIFDDGKLENHRIFWCVDAGSHEISDATRINSTITELAYIPNEVPDGEYLLNLQIAPFDTDCAPSRPMLLQKSAD
ncbi:MAG: cyclase family protein [Acidobacteriota bacterium]|nr:MAG: cyclase family protein [Acidobacteriota bacterium]